MHESLPIRDIVFFLSLSDLSASIIGTSYLTDSNPEGSDVVVNWSSMDTKKEANKTTLLLGPRGISATVEKKKGDTYGVVS